MDHFRSPSKPSKTFATPALWKRNLGKKLREMGMSYISSTGRERPARTIRDACPNTCRLECSLNFTKDDRKQLHANYWQMTNDKKHRFIGQFVERFAKKRFTVTDNNSRRTYSLFYYLPLRDKRLKVCKKFFVNTLSITQFNVQYYFQKVDAK